MALPFDAKVEKLLREKLEARLAQILSHASEQVRASLLDEVLGSGSGSAVLSEKLLDDSCTPHEIYLALVYCRNMMLMLHKKLPQQEQEAYVKQILIHHDRFASYLMTAMENRHSQEWKRLQDELLQEGRANLLSRAVNEWGHESEIHIYNFFKEMPISTVVNLLHVGERSFTVQRNKEIVRVLVASEQGNTAYTRLPRSELSVSLIVEEATRQTVHFQYGEFQPLDRETRREMRVQAETPLPIKLKDARHQPWEGKVHDLSSAGLGITFKSETTLQMGEVVAFSMMLHGHKLAGKGAISWVENRGGQCKAGMGVEYDEENNLRLSNEVRKREKSLFAELNLRGVPDCLLTV